MLNRYTFSIGKSRKQINNNAYPYVNYSIERIEDEVLSKYITPKLTLSIQCSDDLKEYTKIQNKISITSAFVNDNYHTKYKTSTLNVTNVNTTDYIIEGYIENRVPLFLRRLYIDIDNILVIGFNEEHCFNIYDTDIRLYLDYNDHKLELRCVYLDDYTLICREYDTVVLKKPDINNVKSIHREDWVINAQNISFFLLEPSETIDIPITQTFGIAVNDFNSYTKNIVNSLIPKFRDTEKDLYVPVTKITTEQYKSVTDYIFNLHFLSRDFETWKLKDNALWNGVEQDYTFNKHLFDDIPNALEYNHISDLIGYLGFTNNDVKYSKLVLKKSFLRLSYYDGEDLETANLLGYYTVFMDNSGLLSKYNKNKLKGWYNQLNTQQGGFNDVFGIGTLSFPKTPHQSMDNSTRLDSRIHIKGNLKSGQSSEGLNIFLHKQFNKDLTEKTIYLRIEFNNAKYGRTVPMMLPYFYKSDDPTKIGKLKSFKEIVEDEKNGGYTLADFIKYHNIKIKVKNDFENNRYIYWLDRDTYNFETPDDTSTVMFNLYEAKISNSTRSIKTDTDIINTLSNYTLTYKQSIVDKDDDVVLFVPKVSYRLIQTTNTSNKKISDKSVISKQSKFNITINTGNLEKYTDYKTFLDTAQLGKQVVFVKNTENYTIYKIITRQTEDRYDVNASVVVSNRSGKIQVEHYKTFMRLIGSQNNILLATAQSKDVVDGQVLTSEEVTLELRRD